MTPHPQEQGRSPVDYTSLDNYLSRGSLLLCRCHSRRTSWYEGEDPGCESGGVEPKSHPHLLFSPAYIRQSSLQSNIAHKSSAPSVHQTTKTCFHTLAAVESISRRFQAATLAFYRTLLPQSDSLSLSLPGKEQQHLIPFYPGLYHK
jgi:hypothetical protein